MNKFEELLQAAYLLQEAAREYRQVYEAINGKAPVLGLKNRETGEGIFVSDSFHTELIKNHYGFTVTLSKLEQLENKE